MRGEVFYSSGFVWLAFVRSGSGAAVMLTFLSLLREEFFIHILLADGSTYAP